MPKGPKSVTTLCSELGMETSAANDFRNESQAYLKKVITDVVNATDSAVEKLALKYLNEGAGDKHFSFDAALNYQWEASEHRLTITTYVGDIMKQQRWYMIDRLHKRVGGAVNCPGCLLHKSQSNSDANGKVSSSHNGLLDDTLMSDDSDSGSIHHIINKDKDRQSSKKRKRNHNGLEYEVVDADERRKSGESEVSRVTVDEATRESEMRVKTTHTDNHFAAVRRGTGFTPVNPIVVEVQRPSKPETVTPIPTLPPISLSDYSNTMRYRGKIWHFDGIAHKARVLEQIILQEEKDVESYPVLAFSKSTKNNAFGGVEDSGGGDSALKDYFRFYTHFMNERFPASEKILLENGVRPSA